MAVLAFEDDGGVVGVRGLVDGQDDYGAVVTDDVADVFYTGGLDDVSVKTEKTLPL